MFDILMYDYRVLLKITVIAICVVSSYSCDVRSVIYDIKMVIYN
jgi:hypothetical protein